MSTTLPTELIELVALPVWVSVGSRDADLRPEMATATGLRLRPEDGTLTVYIAASHAAPTTHNLERFPQIAVTAAEPISCKTFQMKGAVTAIRQAPEAERWIVERHRAQLFALLAGVCVLPACSNKIASWPAIAFDVTVRDIFAQTPGPRAGERVAQPTP